MGSNSNIDKMLSETNNLSDVKGNAGEIENSVIPESTGCTVS